jgi:hypothetical protein
MSKSNAIAIPTPARQESNEALLFPNAKSGFRPFLAVTHRLATLCISPLKSQISNLQFLRNLQLSTFNLQRHFPQ